MPGERLTYSNRKGELSSMEFPDVRLPSGRSSCVFTCVCVGVCVCTRERACVCLCLYSRCVCLSCSCVFAQVYVRVCTHPSVDPSICAQICFCVCARFETTITPPAPPNLGLSLGFMWQDEWRIDTTYAHTGEFQLQLKLPLAPFEGISVTVTLLVGLSSLVRTPVTHVHKHTRARTRAHAHAHAHAHIHARTHVRARHLPCRPRRLVLCWIFL